MQICVSSYRYDAKHGSGLIDGEPNCHPTHPGNLNIMS